MIFSVGSGLLFKVSTSFVWMSPGRTLLVLLRWGIFLLACFHIYTQLASPKGSQSLHALWALLKGHQLWIVISAVLVLMLVNWWIEAVKWRSLLKPIAPIGMMKAFTATIAGTSIALITPNRTGEFVGRVMFLDPDHRVKGAVAAMLGSIAQFLITLLAGAIGLFFVARSSAWDHAFAGPMLGALASLASALAVFAVVFYSSPRLLLAVLIRLPFLGRWHSDLTVLDRYSSGELLQILLLSALRYVIFSAQFVLVLFHLPGGPALADAIMSVPAILLISTIIPTILLTELGVRGSVALAVLAPVGAAQATILLSTFTIWTVNLMLPAIAGSLILLSARIRTGAER